VSRIPVGKPASFAYVNTPPSWGHPSDVVPAQRAQAIGDADDPAVVAFRERYVGRPATAREAASRLLFAVANGIDYLRDPSSQQWVIAPRHVVAWRWGDCKKMSTLIAAIAYGMGYAVRFAVIAQRDPLNPNHVWAELLTEDGWTAVDPVPRPLRLGRHVDGRIETWEPFERRKTAMHGTIVPVKSTQRIRLRGLSGCGGCRKCALGAVDLTSIGSDTMAALQQDVQTGNVGHAIDTVKDTVAKVTGGGPDVAMNVVKGVATAACAVALAATGYGAALSPLCSLIGPLIAKIKEWITIKINPGAEAYAAAKLQIPELADVKSNKRFLTYPGVPTKDKASYDRFVAGLVAQGWNPRFEWSKSYGSSMQWGSGKGTYYQARFDRQQAPAALQQQWQRTAAIDMRLLLLPQAQMRTEWAAANPGGGAVPGLPWSYDGTPEGMATMKTWAATAGTSIPDAPAADSIWATKLGTGEYPPFVGGAILAPSAPAPGTDVHLPAPGAAAAAAPAAAAAAPRAPSAAPAAAGLPASARPVTAPLPSGSRVLGTPAGLPSTARPVTAAPTTTVPAGGALSIPPGLSTEEASVLVALRQNFGVDVARRAAAAAAAYRRGVGGLGAAASVQLVDNATDAKIAAKLPNRDTLIASNPIKTRAAQVNYGLTHLGEKNEARDQVAEKLIAFKRAASIADPPGSFVNDALRGFLSAQGGFPLGAVPTIAAIAAQLPAGPAAAAPTPGAPAATAAEAAAAAAGMPAGSRQVTPAPSTQAAPPSAGPAQLGPSADGAAAAAAAGLPPGSRPISSATSSGGSPWPWLFAAYVLSQA